MNTKTEHAKTQSCRLLALDAEVLALTAQARALKQIGIEHNHGVDIGSNSPTEYVASSAADVVASLKKTLHEMKSLSADERNERVTAFKGNVDRLEDLADDLIFRRDRKADAHLAESLDEEHGEAKTGDEGNEAKEFKVEAHLHCCASEKEEVRSFVSQVRALCELVLETLCVGAEEAVTR